MTGEAPLGCTCGFAGCGAVYAVVAGREPETLGTWASHYKRLAARAHAEGLEAGLRQAADYLQARSPTYAKLADQIRSLIPAAPLPAGEER